MAKAGVNLAVHSAVVTPSSRNWFLACSYPVSGSEPQCLLQVSNRFITSALLRQHSCEIAMRLGITFIDLHGFAELFKRFVAFFRFSPGRHRDYCELWQPLQSH